MMSAPPHPPEAHVDLSIEVSGGPLPRDHSLPVWNAVAHAEPALMEQTTLAILPVRAAAGYDGRLVLQRRTRLLMRLPESAVDTVLALSGRRLHIGGFPVQAASAQREDRVHRSFGQPHQQARAALQHQSAVVAGGRAHRENRQRRLFHERRGGMRQGVPHGQRMVAGQRPSGHLDREVDMRFRRMRLRRHHPA